MKNGRAYKAVQSPDIHEDEDRVLEPGAFPLDALSGSQRAIATEAAEVYQIDQALPGMGAVAALAGAIGKGHVVTGAVNGRDTHLNLYVNAGAPKSYGKGAASLVVKPLVDASGEMAEHFQEHERPALITERMTLESRVKALVAILAKDGLGSAAPMTPLDRHDLSRELTGKQQRLDALSDLILRPPSYWIGSTTSGALVDFLRRNGDTIFSYSPEAGELVRVALGKFAKNDAADFDLMLSGYTVEPFRETRVGRGDNLLVPCISALWFCQPYLLREIMGNEEATERGLTARVISFVCEHEEIPEDDGQIRAVSPETLSRWDRLIRDILATRPTEEPVKIQCSPEAREAFRAFHNESVRLRNGAYRDIEGELGRWRENAVRLAGGLVVADHYEQGRRGALTLSLDHAERGIRLARWACLSTLSIMQSGRQQRRLERAKKLSKLVTDAGGEITLRELSRSHSFKRVEVCALAEAYPALLSLKVNKPETGRPSEVVSTIEVKQ